jgi:hypothetical protein
MASDPITPLAADNGHTVCSAERFVTYLTPGYTIWSNGKGVHTASPDGAITSNDCSGAGWACTHHDLQQQLPHSFCPANISFNLRDKGLLIIFHYA